MPSAPGSAGPSGTKMFAGNELPEVVSFFHGTLMLLEEKLRSAPKSGSSFW